MRHRARPEAYEVTDSELWLSVMDPAHDGLRIAQLSDLHLGPGTPDQRVLDAVARVNAGRPDLVLLTGDFVTRSPKAIARIGDLLKGLTPPVYVVLGNHDHWVDARGVRRELELLGYTVLQNRHTVTRLRGAPLSVVGIDDAVTFNDDVAASFKGVSRRGTRLVLAHSPPTADKLPENGGLACFSGHTHGGHFHVPGLTDAFFRAARQPYVRGLYPVRGNLLYVNRGLGFGAGGPIVRFRSEPELSFFTLRAA